MQQEKSCLEKWLQNKVEAYHAMAAAVKKQKKRSVQLQVFRPIYFLIKGLKKLEIKSFLLSKIRNSIFWLVSKI